MNVEAYLRAQAPGYNFDSNVLEFAAASPLMAEPTALSGLNLSDRLTDVAKDSDLKRSLKYATSTLYYSVAGVFSGGSRTEQIGDERLTLSGYTITQSDRDYYRKLADEIREELGCAKDSDSASDNGMFDATSLRRR